MAEVFRLMETAAASSISVLIEGRDGHWQELVARAIHRASARPFHCWRSIVPLCRKRSSKANSSAIVVGALHRCDPATVQDCFALPPAESYFSDEVGDMPLSMQAKLLRILEQQEVVPVGKAFRTRLT